MPSELTDFMTFSPLYILLFNTLCFMYSIGLVSSKIKVITQLLFILLLHTDNSQTNEYNILCVSDVQ